MINCCHHSLEKEAGNVKRSDSDRVMLSLGLKPIISTNN